LPEVITDSSAITDSPSKTASSCEPYRELIERWLSDGRHAMSIWQEMITLGAAGLVRLVVRRPRMPRARAVCRRRDRK
jgi:hypothetical protein